MGQHACLSCRASKTRCTLDTFAEYNRCRRCYDSGTECVFQTIPDRQRRRRTDTRVTALEKQVSQLKAALGSPNTQCPNPSEQQTHPAAPSERPGNQVVRGLERPEKDPTDISERVQRHPSHTADRSPNWSEDGVRSWLEPLSPEEAAALFRDFVDHVHPQYPILSVSGDTDFNVLQRDHPVLMLAIVASASRSSDPVLFRILHDRLLRILAEQVILQGRKCLMLLQAMLASEVWYDPPDDINNLNFYMWIQLVGVMAQQLGVCPWGDGTSLNDAQKQGQGLVPTTVGLRTGFAVYVSVSCAAISLRRPMTMTWSHDMSRQLRLFEQHAESTNDHCLIAWVKLQTIAEQVENLRLKLGEMPVPGTLSAGSPGAPYRTIIPDLEARLADWQFEARDVMNESLRIHFYYCRCKLYELAVKICQQQQSTLSMSNQPSYPPDYAQYMDYVRMVMSLLQASHSILDTFIYLDVNTYLRCPTVTTVRALYATKEICSVDSTIRYSYLSTFISEGLSSTKTYKTQIQQFLQRACGEKGFQVPVMGLKGIRAIISSTRTPGSDTAAPGRTPNEMEEILQVDFEGNDNRAEAQIVVASSEQQSSIATGDIATGSGTESALEMDIGHAPMAEFDMMMMPEDVIDPSWLSAGLGLEQ